MQKQRQRTDMLGGVASAECGFPKQRSAQPLTLDTSIDGQAGKNDGWDGIRHVSTDFADRDTAIDRAS